MAEKVGDQLDMKVSSSEYNTKDIEKKDMHHGGRNMLAL